MSAVPESPRVLVVGTTPDYVQWIRTVCSGRSLFLTRPAVRRMSEEPLPPESEEILMDLEDTERAGGIVATHLKKWHQRVSGIACFDCESLIPASLMARMFQQPFPDVSAICNSRDKYISKQLWHAAGISCPQVCAVDTPDQVIGFLKETGGDLVLKPFAGAGSELVFRCGTPDTCRVAFDTIGQGLETRDGNPLFFSALSREHRMLAEEWIQGPEYSCDVLLEKGCCRILRMARKIHIPGMPFGTTRGYVLVSDLPPGYGSRSRLSDLLARAANALGLDAGICMVDFMLARNTPVLIEMTPRPGGDCLPHLIRHARGLDMLGLSLDVAEGLSVSASLDAAGDEEAAGCGWTGIRIHAPRGGIFSGIDMGSLAHDARIRQVHWIRKPGHRVIMPPENYDSWLLGHLIIRPDNLRFPESQSLLLARQLTIRMTAP